MKKKRSPSASPKSSSSSSSPTFFQKDVNVLFVAAKRPDLKKIFVAVTQHGLAILDASKTPNGETIWSMAVKNKKLSKIFITLYDEKLIADEEADRIIRTYLFSKDKNTKHNQLMRDAFQELSEHKSLTELIANITIDETIILTISKEDTKTVEENLTQCPHLHSCIKTNGNLAHYAANFTTQPGMLTLLKKYKVDLEYKHNDLTPLMLTMKHGNIVALKELVELGANCEAAALDGTTVIEVGLFYALAEDDTTIETKQAACINYLWGKTKTPINYNRLLTTAVLDGAVNFLKNFNSLKSLTGDDVDLAKVEIIVKKQKLSVVQFASYIQNLEILKILIEQHGLSPDLRNDAKGNTALAYASSSENLPMIKYLLEQGADITIGVKNADPQLEPPSLPWLHGVCQSNSKHIKAIIEGVLRTNPPNREEALNLPGIITRKKGNPQGVKFTPIQQLAYLGQAESVALFLGDPDVETYLTPSLYFIALLGRRPSMISLLSKYDVIMDLQLFENIAHLSPERRKIFSNRAIVESTTDLFSPEYLPNIDVLYRLERAKYNICKDVDPEKANQIAVRVSSSARTFWDKHQNDFGALINVACEFHEITAPNFYILLMLIKTNQPLVDVNNLPLEFSFLLIHVQSWFQSFLEKCNTDFPVTKSPKEEKASTQELTYQASFSSDNETTEVMSALEFLRKKHSFGVAGAKQKIAEAKKKLSSPTNVGLWKVDPHKPEPSWLEGTLKTSDKRVKKIDNNEHYYIFISDQVNFDGPYLKKLLEKERWTFAPTNAIHQLHGDFAVELIINGVTFKSKFNYEISAKGTADRILCCTLSDEKIGKKLLIPCYYCKDGLHKDKVNLPGKVKLEIAQANCTKPSSPT